MALPQIGAASLRHLTEQNETKKQSEEIKSNQIFFRKQHLSMLINIKLGKPINENQIPETLYGG